MKHDTFLTIQRVSDGPCETPEEKERRILVLQSGAIRFQEVSKNRAVAPCVVIIPKRSLFIASNNSSGSLVRVGACISESFVQSQGLASLFRRTFGGDSTQALQIEPGQVLTAEALIREIASELDAHQAGFEAMVIAKFTEFLVALLRFTTHQPRQIEGSTSPDVWSIQRAIKHAQERYDEPFSLLEIANRCALNTTSFSREFKRVAGSPLFEYVNKIRIQKACILLKRTRRPVIDIAMDVGYNNISFFNRYFKKTMGMSPTTYRAAVRR